MVGKWVGGNEYFMFAFNERKKNMHVFLVSKNLLGLDI
jgi:hypothetical protein